jgi:paraquat-inducible protein A
VVEEIGRWSMVDPFTISFVGPLLQYGQLTSSFAGAGSLAFTLVVVVTVLATRAFDPRLMWDAAAKSQARIPATQPSETLA